MAFVRTNIRNYFPRAKEGKRVKIYGWKTRMNLPEQRRIIMRRIVKGRHVLSH
jgi:large subunit ribosomal protein L34